MELDEFYPKSPKWKNADFLPLVIEHPPVEIKKEDTPPLDKENIFTHFDDEKIVFKFTSSKKMNISDSKIAFVVAGLFLIFSIVFPKIKNFDSPSWLLVFFVTFIPFALGVYWRIRAIKLPEHVYITLYRTTGLIELPRNSKGHNGYFLIRFTDLKAIIKSVVTSFSYMAPRVMFIIDPTPFFNPIKGSDWKTMSWIEDPTAYWSFYVWYMDRNRPLPPGSAFDAYRQKDYERRKAEGFPPPLFESKIPTPEHISGSGSSIVDNLN